MNSYVEVSSQNNYLIGSVFVILLYYCQFKFYVSIENIIETLLYQTFKFA